MPNLRRYATSLSTRWEVNDRNIANEWSCTTVVHLSPPPVHLYSHTESCEDVLYCSYVSGGWGGGAGSCAGERRDIICEADILVDARVPYSH